MADLASTRVFGKLTVMHDAIVKANAEITGSVTAASFAGDGSALTALNASALATGTVDEARLPASAMVGDTTYTAGTGLALSGTTFSLSDERFTSALLTKLNGIEAGAEVNVVTSVAGKTGAVTLASSDVGLGSVRNVSSYSQTEADANFAPISHNHTLSEISDSGSAAALDAPSTGDATATQVVKGDDSRLTDARAPTSHGHDVAEITGLSDAATTTVATIQSGTTASNVGLGSVRNVASHSQTEADGRFVRADTGSTINVGRGNVFIENNAGDNIDGAGVTLRTEVNPAGGSPGAVGSIFAIRSSGEALRFWVGQSVTSAGDNSFEAGGDITAYSSDARLKENVEEIEDALGKLAQLRGVTYDWIAECEELGFRPSNPHEHGVIAQEVQKVVPDAVAPAPFNRDYLTVKYDRLVPLLIQGLKEETAKREALEERLAKLEAMMGV